MVTVEDDLGQGLVSDALSQHGAAVEGDLLLLVAPAQREHYLRSGANVLHGRGPGPDLSPQHVVENLRSILLSLKTDP